MLKRLQDNLENGFADFPGLTVTGSVPIKQEFLNELLNDVLQSFAGPGASAPGGGSGGGVSVQKLAGLVKKLAVRAETGVVILDFEVGR